MTEMGDRKDGKEEVIGRGSLAESSCEDSKNGLECKDEKSLNEEDVRVQVRRSAAMPCLQPSLQQKTTLTSDYLLPTQIAGLLQASE
jgi:hypothetical protein